MLQFSLISLECVWLDGDSVEGKFFFGMFFWIFDSISNILRVWKTKLYDGYAFLDEDENLNWTAAKN